MKTISYRRHRFPPSIIQHAVWLYYRFTLSYRDVEDMLAEQGIDVSHETVRRWCLKYGISYAQRLRPGDLRLPQPGTSTRSLSGLAAGRCISALGRRGRRSFGGLAPIETEQDRRCEVSQESNEETLNGPGHHRQLQVAADGNGDPRYHALSGTHSRNAIEQSS